jgi:signal transduction histidine kinase
MRLNLDLMRRITDPQKQLQRIETVAAQEQHLTRLLSDMMTMLSLDDGQSAFTFKPLDPYFIGQLVFDEHHSPAQQKKQTLIFNRALDPLTVRADQLELQRALNKLVTNALTYTPEEGKITISIFREASNALIEVCDNGIGISTDDLAHIFQRFYRADEARSMHTGGAGLGLPIVQKIVEAHGGSVEVESTLGQGSVFRLRLPLMLDGTQPEHVSLRDQLINQLPENQRQKQLGNKR